MELHRTWAQERSTHPVLWFCCFSKSRSLAAAPSAVNKRLRMDTRNSMWESLIQGGRSLWPNLGWDKLLLWRLKSQRRAVRDSCPRQTRPEHLEHRVPGSEPGSRTSALAELLSACFSWFGALPWPLLCFYIESHPIDVGNKTPSVTAFLRVLSQTFRVRLSLRGRVGRSGPVSMEHCAKFANRAQPGGPVGCQVCLQNPLTVSSEPAGERWLSPGSIKTSL